MRRRSPQRSKLTVVLGVALGLLTPMAANMVGAQAGANAAPSGTSVVAVVASAPPRGLALPASGVRPDPREVARAAARVARWTNVLVEVPRTLPAFAWPRLGAAQVGVVPSGSKYFGIRIVAMTYDQLVVSVAAPPRTRAEAEAVAAEHYAFCPDNIDQSPPYDLDAYAEKAVLNQEVWSF